MSKTKKIETPYYELLYIISNKFSEDELKPVVESVEKIITENGGTITYREEWGKEKLAYQIGQFAFGYYFYAEFEAPAEKMEKINRTLKLDNEILRHQIVSKKKKTEAEKRKEKEITEKIAAKVEIRKKAEEDKEREKAKGKVDLKELDEKLDKILETDDLL